MSRSGLPPPSHRSTRVAVVILDVISTYTFPGGTQLARAVLSRADAIASLRDRARTHRVPVVYVNDNLGHWDSDFPAIVRATEASAAPVPQIAEALKPRKGDHVLLKPRHSAFYGTPLEALLEHLRISTLVLCGVSAESCVLATACDAHTRGFGLIVPADALAGSDARAVRRTLSALSQAFGASVPRRAASIRFERGHVR